MTQLERLLKAYIEEHRATGTADPRAYLAEVEGSDRLELEALIDGYLSRAPRRAWDPGAYERSPAGAVVEPIARSLVGEGGSWPELLPRLRRRAKIKRADLVARLAAALGAAGREERVARYYHEMEQGLLPASGVADRVLESLGDLLGESATTLRQAGRTLGPAAGEASAGVAFARTTRSAPEGEMTEAFTVAASAPASMREDWDEIDELFRGGSSV